MTISNFDKRLLIEQIRYMETQQPLACDAEEKAPDHSVHNDFEDRLWQRAQCLVEQHDLSPVLGRAARLSRYVKTVALMVVALLGALGIIYAVTDSFTINIYWLLLVLLGFNLLSMLLWLTGISMNMEGLTAGMLARLTGWLPGHLESKNKASTQADRAWLSCNFDGAVGKWQFSKITHQLWLVYLLAGLVFLVLLLMVRQYDFVWGTTLLSDTAFVKLTDVLSAPLQALGFATPSADQVQESRIGVAQSLTVEHRNRWAQFLLGALLCFGIVPRLLLWSWSALMCVKTRRLFALDFYLPYYISLRQRLMPLASHGQIIDADTSPPVISVTPVIKPVPHTLPAETQWVAVELGDNMSWPPLSISATNDLGQVIDRESLRSILQRLQSNACPVIAVAVSSARPPDRGVQRTIASLMLSSEQRWLVLLKTHEDEPVSSTRLAAWYRLAEACKVPADHVISMGLV
ncbi:MAG: DUF2868 domain-containing protein [Gammaproteobacteria bacterium]|nr:DUF2868 domain-containing protein [Gammaproteobacteria bacterium]